jgi:hypothetical protein
MIDTTGHKGRQVKSGLVATGTNQATALPLSNASDNQVVTTANSTGVILPIARDPSSITVWNGGASNLAIYPPLGGQINDGTVNAAFILLTGTGAAFFSIDGPTWYVVGGASGTGTVTSVNFQGDGTVLSSTPSAAVTTAGTVVGTLATQAAHAVLIGPTTGAAVAPTFRALVTADMPSGVGAGTVTSITFTGDGTVLSSTPSTAITTAGTIAGTLATQSANTMLSGPASGGAVAPTFRAMVAADLPASLVTYSKIQNVTAHTLLGNPTGSAAPPSEITLTGLSFVGSALVATSSGPTIGMIVAFTSVNMLM